mmetsp:Transcript_10219/g.31557  ORF Transcript_10219/g.31557 Transcript_10219/m.31557 type:complete len:409 (-) Transcript_10219:618-1844(-)
MRVVQGLSGQHRQGLAPPLPPLLERGVRLVPEAAAVPQRHVVGEDARPGVRHVRGAAGTGAPVRRPSVRRHHAAQRSDGRAAAVRQPDQVRHLHVPSVVPELLAPDGADAAARGAPRSHRLLLLHRPQMRQVCQRRAAHARTGARDGAAAVPPLRRADAGGGRKHLGPHAPHETRQRGPRRRVPVGVGREGARHALGPPRRERVLRVRRVPPHVARALRRRRLAAAAAAARVPAGLQRARGAQQRRRHRLPRHARRPDRDHRRQVLARHGAPLQPHQRRADAQRAVAAVPPAARRRAPDVALPPTRGLPRGGSEAADVTDDVDDPEHPVRGETHRLHGALARRRARDARDDPRPGRGPADVPGPCELRHLRCPSRRQLGAQHQGAPLRVDTVLHPRHHEERRRPAAAD